MRIFVLFLLLLVPKHTKAQSLISYPYPLHTGDRCNAQPYSYAGIDSGGQVCGCSNQTNTWNCGGSGTGNMLTSVYDIAAYASQVEVTAHKDAVSGYVGLSSVKAAVIPGGVDTSNGGTNPLIITGLHVAAASVTAPAANNLSIFYDLSNSDHLSVKNSSNAVTDLQGSSGASLNQVVATNSIDLSNPGGFANTYFTFDTNAIVYGTGAVLHSGTVNPSRFIASATGTYSFSYNYVSSTSTDSTLVIKNGTAFVDTSAIASNYLSKTITLPLASGDYLEFGVTSSAFSTGDHTRCSIVFTKLF